MATCLIAPMSAFTKLAVLQSQSQFVAKARKAKV
jgi:hypothetical protein